MMPPIHVLLADDSDIIRRAIRRLLADDPSITLTGEAKDNDELLQMLSRSRPDVVLMDVHMPGENQSDAVRDLLRGLCVLVISIWNDEETESLAQSYGAWKLLDKTSLESTLIPAIKECISERAHHA